MTLFSIPMGPHDVPFAAPLMTGTPLAFTIGCVILNLMDRFIGAEAHSTPSNTSADAK